MKRLACALVLLGTSAAIADDAPDVIHRPAYTATIRAISAKRLELVVETRAGYHLNDDYPLHFTPVVSDHVRFEKPRIDRDAMTLAQCTPPNEHLCRASIPVAFSADGRGWTQLGGVVAFSACDADQCLIEKVSLSTKVKRLR